MVPWPQDSTSTIFQLPHFLQDILGHNKDSPVICVWSTYPFKWESKEAYIQNSGSRGFITALASFQEWAKTSTFDFFFFYPHLRTLFSLLLENVRQPGIKLLTWVRDLTWNPIHNLLVSTPSHRGQGYIWLFLKVHNSGPPLPSSLVNQGGASCYMTGGWLLGQHVLCLWLLIFLFILRIWRAGKVNVSDLATLLWISLAWMQ